MPKYSAGERVDFIPITSSHPDTAVFQLTDDDGNPVMQPLTVSNGGLTARRKGALHPVFHAPHIPGSYRYRFWDSEQVASGTIKVERSASALSAPTRPAAQGQQQTAPTTPTPQRMGIVE